MTLNTLGVVVVLVAVSLAGASLNCTFPGNTPEGCVYCYSCKVQKETVESIKKVPTKTLDLGKCKAIVATYGILSPTEALCRSLGGYGFDVYTTVMKTVSISTTVQEKCVCDTTPVAKNCLNSTDNIVFTLGIPASKTFDSSITICHWNLPRADQVYMQLLKQDIEGNPNDGENGCKDNSKLIVKSEDWTEDLVTCGSLPSTRPAARICNRVYSKVPSVFFYSENGTKGCSFRILVCLERRKDTNTMGSMIAAGNQPLGDGRENITINTGAPPRGNPCTTCCTCPPFDIKSMCSNGSLARNTFIKRLQSLSRRRNCDGIGQMGFSGLKGCIGAEFLTRGTPPTSLTEEQCENMRLGMTDMEAEMFMASKGGSLWCGCNLVSSSPGSFCGGDTATRPDAEELIKLEQLVEGRGDAEECARSDNEIVRKVAAFLRENSNTIPALVPCPEV